MQIQRLLKDKECSKGNKLARANNEDNKILIKINILRLIKDIKLLNIYLKE